jgi:hypothetical protein
MKDLYEQMREQQQEMSGHQFKTLKNKVSKIMESDAAQSDKQPQVYTKLSKLRKLV